MYKSDERHGPGVYTYTDTSQDVGLWHREKIVRLCSESKNGFDLTPHTVSEHGFDPSLQHKQNLYPELHRNRTDVIEDIVNPPPMFRYPPSIDIRSRAEGEIFHDSLDRQSLAIDIR